MNQVFFHWISQISLQNNFVIKCVWLQHSTFSKVAKMMYNSISDAYSGKFAPNLYCTITRIWSKSLCKLDNNFTNLPFMAVWTWSHFNFVLQQSSKMASEMTAKFKLTFVQYWFMNLIFIYFSKRGRCNYWRWSLIRRHMVLNIIISFLEQGRTHQLINLTSF